MDVSGLHSVDFLFALLKILEVCVVMIKYKNQREWCGYGVDEKGAVEDCIQSFNENNDI